MTQELKAFTVNMKSLDQDIPDPVVAGAGDANGRTFRILHPKIGKTVLKYLKIIYSNFPHQKINCAQTVSDVARFSI